jgi:uncharacterized protein (DUF427 family)
VKTANASDSPPPHRIAIRPARSLLHVEVAGQVLVHTSEALVLEETRCAIRYYVAPEQVDRRHLERTATSTHCPYKGDASYWALRIDDRVVQDVAWAYEDPIPECEQIRDHICFYPSRVDVFLVDGADPRAPAPTV